MATVFVWENHFIARHTGDHTWTGHSSMSIDDIFADNRALTNDGEVDDSSTALAQGNSRFVSVWPGSTQLSGPKANSAGPHPFMRDCWKPCIDYMATCKPSIFADVALEGYAPDHVIRITGLSVSKMKAKWQSIRLKANAHYKFLRKNCSTIVARVLSAATPWYKTPTHVIWSPTDIRDFGMKLGTTMLWSDFIDELAGTGYCMNQQLDLLRGVKRRCGSRGTSGGLAKFPNA
jgi:hypothetical protein